MPKSNNPTRPKSFRLSSGTICKLLELAATIGAAQSTVLEIAIDRMHREEVTQKKPTE